MNRAEAFVIIIVIAVGYFHTFGSSAASAEIEVVPSSCLRFQLEVDAITKDEGAFIFQISDEVSITQRDALSFTVWEPDFPRDSDGRRFQGQFSVAGVTFSNGISRFATDLVNGTASEQIRVSVAFMGYVPRGNYSTSMRVRIDSIQFGFLDVPLLITIVVRPSLWTAYVSTFGGVVLNTAVTMGLAAKSKRLNRWYWVGPLVGAPTALVTVDRLLVQYQLFGSYAYLDWTFGLAYGFANVALFDKIRDWAEK